MIAFGFFSVLVFNIYQLQLVSSRNTEISVFEFKYGDIGEEILNATRECAFSIDSRTLGECIDEKLLK